MGGTCDRDRFGLAWSYDIYDRRFHRGGFTYTIQRLIVQARAQRIPVGGRRAESLTGLAP